VSATGDNNRILEIEDLSVSFAVEEGVLRAVDGLSLTIGPDEVVGLVGESGCGKSVTALSVLRLLPFPQARMDSGRVLYRGRDILAMPPEEIRSVRGNGISMIFQEPMTALSPLHRIGSQLSEALRLHAPLSRREAWDRAVEALRRVGIPDPSERAHSHPHELSGGMRQRVMIAMALLHDPDLVIADEPTTALDVTVQAQVFDLMLRERKPGSALLLITHDMSVVWETCTRVAVMYASEIVEEGPVDDVFAHPLHPYTEALLASIPARTPPGERLRAIRGQVPSPLNYPRGCRFHDRCPFAFERCASEHPALGQTACPRPARCFLAAKRAGNGGPRL